MTKHRTGLDETRARIEAKREDKQRLRATIDLEISIIDEVLALLNEAADPAAKKRARPGVIQAAVMKTLALHPATVEQLADELRAHSDSVRAALKRLAAAGKLRRDGDSYSVAAIEEAAQ